MTIELTGLEKEYIETSVDAEVIGLAAYISRRNYEITGSKEDLEALEKSAKMHARKAAIKDILRARIYREADVSEIMAVIAESRKVSE